MDDRLRRLAENERLFRDVNNRIEETAAKQGADTHRFDFLCECSELNCGATITMTLAEYERARAAPTVFVVAPGHELPEIEEIIERAPGWYLVRKFGEAAEIARGDDR